MSAVVKHKASLPFGSPLPFRLPKVKRLTAPVVREPVLHRQIADILRLEIAPPGRVSRHGVVWWSVDMAAYAGVAPGLRTLRGCIAGVPDIVLIHRGLSHFIELKAADGVLSPAQTAVGTSILICGGNFAVARSLEEVLELLDAWHIPRAHRIRRSLSQPGGANEGAAKQC